MDCSTPGFPSPTPEVSSNSCPLSCWCHPTISSSVTPSPPAFNLSQNQGLFKWIGSSHQVAKVLVSASTSVLPMDIQHWFLWGWTGWISLQPKGLLRVFSNTTVQKHQFFGAQLSLWSTGKTIALISLSNYFYLCYILYVTSSTF